MSSTVTHEQLTASSVGRGARRIGYVIAAAANGVALWLAHRLPDWEWPRFLTRDFEELLPILTVSFVAGILANLVYAWRDDWPVKPLGEMLTTAIGFAVAVRTFRVFPFDFAQYDTDWSWLARLVVVIAILGTAVGVVVQMVKLASGPSRPQAREA